MVGFLPVHLGLQNTLGNASARTALITVTAKRRGADGMLTVL